jgi:hypothetical protein
MEPLHGQARQQTIKETKQNSEKAASITTPNLCGVLDIDMKHFYIPLM